MNKKNTAQLKDSILIIMGIVISIAGIIFIIVQYRKLLSAPSSEEDRARNRDRERIVTKIRNHFKQIQEDEGTSPELIDEGDISIDVE